MRLTYTGSQTSTNAYCLTLQYQNHYPSLLHGTKPFPIWTHAILPSPDTSPLASLSPTSFEGNNNTKFYIAATSPIHSPTPLRSHSVAHYVAYQNHLEHRLWSCPPIQAFWSKVELFVASLTDLAPHSDPFLLLFGTWCFKASKPQARILTNHNIWLSSCYMIARRSILAKWIQDSPPTLRDLRLGLQLLHDREALDIKTSNSHNTAKFNRKWSTFLKPVMLY